MKRTSTFSTLLLALIFLLLLGATAMAQTIRYVRPGYSGTGISWAAASGDLQLVLNQSVAGDEIWVAAGTHIPKRPANSPDETSTNDRNNAFVLKEGVKVYGGFPATGNPTMANRNWETNVTILSGDFLNNDTYNANGLPLTNNTENAYHVVAAIGNAAAAMTSATLLDGFTIKAGCATGSALIGINGEMVNPTFGGGIMIQLASPTLSHLIVTGNAASTSGGINVTFDSSPYLSDIKFLGNQSYSGGGGLYTYGSPSLAHNLFFKGNVANGSGGALFTSAVTTVTNGVFVSNSSIRGAAIYNGSSGESLFTNCTIASNSASGFGGGLYNSGSNPILRNCIVQNNSAPTGPDVNNVSGGSASFSYSSLPTAASGWTGIGQDLGGNITQTVTFTNPATNDYSVVAGGATIDAGNSDFYAVGFNPDLSWVLGDIAGYMRIQGNAVDMGAYESGGQLQMHEAEALSDLHFYPNPTESIVNLTSDKIIDHIEVYSMLGQKLLSQKGTSGQNVVHLENLAKGSYVVRVFSAEASESFVAIKK